jgi:uncharacterized protein YkwD
MNTLLRKLKAHFIPHQENDFKPHFFATASVLFFSAAIVVVFLLSVLQFAAISSGNNFLASVVSSTLVDITNQNRVAYSERSLSVSPVLERAAQAKANDMAAKSYFAHTSPEGVTPWHWFQQAGYTFSYAGENLAVNFSDSVNVGEAWMKSPGHRANILNNNFTEIGIATSQGTYEGEPTTFVVQLFGKPAGSQSVPEGGAIVNKETTQTAPKEISTLGAEVAGTSLETVAVNDMFVAVKNTAATGTADESTLTIPKSSFFARLLASPQSTLGYAYVIFGLLVVLALALDTFIEIRRHHPRHLFYAILLWVLILTLLYIGGIYIFPKVIIK